MIDIATSIIEKLRLEQCPEHGAHPEITEKEGEISIAACCQPFHQAIAGKLEKGMEEQMMAAIEAAMRNMEK